MSTVSRGSGLQVNPHGRRRWRAAATIAWLLAWPLAVGTTPSFAREVAQPAYDLIIEHGRVVDGTGAPWYAADVGIRAGRIVAIGRLDKATARQRIDATGRIVAPGFIDMLGQSELTLLVNPHVPSKIFQGITTEITGEGNSVAPVNDAIAEEQAAAFEHYQIKLDWSDFSGYFARLERQGIGINMGSYVGATTVREMIVGYADRAATASELAQMQALVGDSYPFAILAALLPLPRRGMEVVAGDAGDGRNHGVRADGQAVDFNQAHGGAANLRSRCVEDQTLALQ